MLNSLKKFFGAGQAPAAPATYAPPPEPEPEPEVPEVTTVALLEELSNGATPLILDIREPFELQQVRLPESEAWTLLHIPMNSLPERLDALPPDGDIVVLCAHGNRSYGVTHYLNEQGFQARNLAGGITDWYIRGGAVAQ